MTELATSAPPTQTLPRVDGRRVAYIDYGPPSGTPVLWCHGGPGSRLEPALAAQPAAAAGFRLIGIDRPGYGGSTPMPGRSIADWVPDGLAVADALGISTFLAVGVSTGGAYALALAALAPSRVLGVCMCCAVTDLRWTEGKAMLANAMNEGVWRAKSRAEAIVAAEAGFGADGARMTELANAGPPLPAADQAVLAAGVASEVARAASAAAQAARFALGVQGYVDDRLADGVGWGSFAFAAVRAPVHVLHGEADTIVPVAHAHHTAAIVPGARLQVVPALGHFSIAAQIVPALPLLLVL